MFVLWCYGIKFLPTIATVLIWQFFSLFTLCSRYAKVEATCYYIYPNTTTEAAWGGWGEKAEILLIVQHIGLIIIVLHFGNSPNFTLV